MAVIAHSAAQWREISEMKRQAAEAAETERREKVETLRKGAQDLGAKLMAMRQDRFTGQYADKNPEFVSDPDIDVLEIRYSRAVAELEALDRE